MLFSALHRESLVHASASTVLSADAYPIIPSPSPLLCHHRLPPPQVQMLQTSYDIGARVSTNSWGAVRTTYTSLDRQMDNAAYVLPDMVIVVAAGNCGDIISECSYQVRCRS